MLTHAAQLCTAAATRAGRIVVLTGAGISAESGIPTFRGAEGYWTVGATEYHPQELATFAAYRRMPLDVWAWYLYRRGVCRGAAPNPAHHAVVELERALGDRFALVTQNVDGLHLRAGNQLACTYQIHGNIDFARCGADCTTARWPLGDDVPALGRGDAVSPALAARLRCPRCGALARPHVLWFDESYDEERYHLDTVRQVAAAAALLIVVGTSAQTNLPWQVVRLAASAGATLIDVNVEANPFAEIAERSGGAAVRASATAALGALVAAIVAAAR